MSVVESILLIFEYIILVLIISFAILYCIPIIFIRRFHQPNNMLTFNVCLATISSAVYWMYYEIYQQKATAHFSDDLCAFLSFIQTVFTLHTPLSIVTVSIHRFCIVIYHTKNFFRTKRWVLICCLSQWILGVLLSLVALFGNQSVR
jgi:hypothetical protein